MIVMVLRALGFGEPQQIIYTAQNRLDARRKWEDDFLRILEHSPFANNFKVRRQVGQESVRWDNGSVQGISSSTERAGHGQTLDLAVIDEAFAQDDARLEQALKPTMVTRPEPQLWIVSTAGTMRSVYLRGKVDAGRQQCNSLTSDMAYFEWSSEGGEDPADPITWIKCMPALGRTIGLEVVRTNFNTMQLREFRRAFLNQWPEDTADEWATVSFSTWIALADSVSPPPEDPVAFALDVNLERTMASIAVAGLRDGLLRVEIPDGCYRPGTEWVVPRLSELVRRWRPCAVVVDPAATAGSLLTALEREMDGSPTELVKVTAREATHAAGQFFEAVVSGTLRHRNQGSLNTALGGAERAFVGDAWKWTRRGSAIDITPLTSATLALYGYQTRGHLFGGDVGVWNINGPSSNEVRPQTLEFLKGGHM